MYISVYAVVGRISHTEMDVWVDAKWEIRGIYGQLVASQKRHHFMEMTSQIFTKGNPLGSS
jgi:hypothetical protein